MVIPPILWVGSQGGPEGIAWTLLLLRPPVYMLAWFFLVRPLCEAKLLEYSVAALRPFVLATVAIAPAFVLGNQFDGSVLRLIIGIALAAPIYLAVSFFVNREWVQAMWELAGRPAGSKKR